MHTLVIPSHLYDTFLHDETGHALLYDIMQPPSEHIATTYL